MCIMGKQFRVNLTIDEKVVEKAKSLGLNLSKVSENALIRGIKALEEAYEVKSSKEDILVDREGFEPPTSALQARRSYH